MHTVQLRGSSVANVMNVVWLASHSSVHYTIIMVLQTVPTVISTFCALHNMDCKQWIPTIM